MLCRGAAWRLFTLALLGINCGPFYSVACPLPLDKARVSRPSGSTAPETKCKRCRTTLTRKRKTENEMNGRDQSQNACREESRDVVNNNNNIKLQGGGGRRLTRLPKLRRWWRRIGRRRGALFFLFKKFTMGSIVNNYCTCDLYIINVAAHVSKKKEYILRVCMCVCII